ncbi:MAG: M14 family zinc carboxypeptidase, partial [Pseudomonadota bacterium]
MRKVLEKRLPELIQLESLVEKVKNQGEVRVLTEVSYDGYTFPIYSIEIGNGDPTTPCFALIGGVHGLERIGTMVVNSTLATTIELLGWDQTLKNRLKQSRLVFIPLLNPVGMYRRSRSNGNNVDLMRNAPVYSEEATRFLYGGHRLSPKIPFYRGALADGMEEENQVLCDFLKERVFPASLSICLDVHSGFGATDRLWFPYARTRKPFPYFVEAYAFRELLNKTYP